MGLGAIADGMRITHVSPSSWSCHPHLRPWLQMLLTLAALATLSPSAAMESSAELSAAVGAAVDTVISGEMHRPSRPDAHAEWKSARTKVKRRQRLNAKSNLPTIHTNSNSNTSNSSSGNSNLSSWQQQRYLKVNQVFESERRMSRDEIQRNHGKIVLLGLFELSTKRGPRPDGLSELGAATMAVEHINRKRLLPGYTLELVTNDTQVSRAAGGRAKGQGEGAPRHLSLLVGDAAASITKLNFHLVARATLKLNKKICNRSSSAE